MKILTAQSSFKSQNLCENPKARFTQLPYHSQVLKPPQEFVNFAKKTQSLPQWSCELYASAFSALISESENGSFKSRLSTMQGIF